MILLPLIDNKKLGFWKRPKLYSLSRKRREGNVKFTEKSLCVSRNKNVLHHYLEDVTYLEIHGDLYLDCTARMVPDVPQDMKISHSGRTKFILHFEKKKIEINFLISTQNEFHELVDLLKVWYQSKQFKIREYDLSKNRMLILSPYWSYESIQKIKQEIGVESMYS